MVTGLLLSRTISANMKHRVWSRPNLRWEGFQPVPYWFDLQKTLALPLTRKSDDGKTDLPTTVGDLFVLFRDKTLGPESFETGIGEDKLVTQDASLKVVINGPSFNRDILKTMLKLRSEGINPSGTVWYYFDHDSCLDYPQEVYSFFVVANDKIARERVAFSDDPTNGFDPTIFETHDYKYLPFGDMPDWDKADTRYWYRKFYRETRTGQLMALRPGKPRLFFYEHTGPDLMSALGALNQSLVRIKLLLWVLVIVSVVSLVIHWK
jgi:hypothetical protein